MGAGGGRREGEGGLRGGGLGGGLGADQTDMRLLLVSATYTAPDPPTATPYGWLKLAFPEPEVPKAVIQVPDRLRTTILLLLESTTYKRPAGSMATSTG